MKKLFYILTGAIVGISLIGCTNKAVLTNTPEDNKTVIQETAKLPDNQETGTAKDKKPEESTTVQTQKPDEKPAQKPTQKPDQKPAQKPEIAQVKKVIVLDPGHANRSNLEKEPLAPGSKELKIKDGGGAAGVITRTPEYKVNMEVALKLKPLLEQKGYEVTMTKTENSQSLGNVERAEIWNKANADLVVRIHADSSESSVARGASMLVPAPVNENTKAIYEKSKEYGQSILSSVVSQVGMANRGVVERKDMTGFNWSKVPVVLIEMGFLSNKDEDKLLSSSEYQSKIAKALANAISNAVK